jgi:hypothetical protein
MPDQWERVAHINRLVPKANESFKLGEIKKKKGFSFFYYLFIRYNNNREE